MWAKLSKAILQNRIPLLIFFLVITIFMAWNAKNLKLSYAGSKILPLTDSVFIKYNNFKKQFGEDGSVVVLGIQDKAIYTKENYTKWVQLTNEIQKLQGIKGVLSIGKLFELQKDKNYRALKAFYPLENYLNFKRTPLIKNLSLVRSQPLPFRLMQQWIP